MDLEKRVQALEEEVEILKNQIQATLLDIQEQILTNTYQTLRSDSISTSHSARSTADTADSPVKTFKPVDDASVDIRPANGANIANVRKVTLESPEPAPAATVAESDSKAITWASMDEMEAWVSTKIEKLGVERTREIIYMYFERGRLTSEYMDTLFELIELYDGEMSRPFEFEDTTRPSPPPVRKPPQAASRQQARHPASSKPAVAPQQKASRQPAANPSPASVPARKSAPRNVKPAKSTVISADPATAEAGSKTVAEPEPEERATILRLIAGVYNAGAGVKWGKKHG